MKKENILASHGSTGDPPGKQLKDEGGSVRISDMYFHNYFAPTGISCKCSPENFGDHPFVKAVFGKIFNKNYPLAAWPGEETFLLTKKNSVYKACLKTAGLGVSVFLSDERGEPYRWIKTKGKNYVV